MKTIRRNLVHIPIVFKIDFKEWLKRKIVNKMESILYIMCVYFLGYPNLKVALLLKINFSSIDWRRFKSKPDNIFYYTFMMWMHFNSFLCIFLVVLSRQKAFHFCKSIIFEIKFMIFSWIQTNILNKISFYVNFSLL